MAEIRNYTMNFASGVTSGGRRVLWAAIGHRLGVDRCG